MKPTDNENLNRELSPGGHARKEDMLAELLGDLSSVRRRRKFRRGLLSISCVVLAAFGALRFVALHESTRHRAEIEIVSTHDLSNKVVWIETDATIIERLRAEPNPLVMQINDAQLLETLVQIGRPAGLIRFGDRLALSAPVTDAELYPESAKN